MNRLSKISGVVMLGLCPSDVGTADGFSPGPLELDWFGSRTDGNLRTTYLETRASSILYGGGPISVRQHKEFERPLHIETGPHDAQLSISAVETFTFRPSHNDVTTLGMVHFSCNGSEVVTALHSWLVVPPGTSGSSQAGIAIQSMFGAGFAPSDRGRRIASVSLLLPSFSPSVRSDLSAGPNSWSELDELLWLSASLTPLERFPPDREDPELLTGKIFLSESWRALALRDGIGFVGRSKEDGFFQSAEILVRTVYTDVIMLAHLQDLELNCLSNSLSATFDRAHEGDKLKRLVKRATTIRNQLWWDDVTTHGQGNTILRATQHQLKTERLFTRVMEDLGVFRDQVDSEEIESTRIGQERFESMVKRAGSALAGASIVLGLFGCNIAGITSGGGARWWVIGAATILAGTLGWLIARQFTRRPS